MNDDSKKEGPTGIMPLVLFVSSVIIGLILIKSFIF